MRLTPPATSTWLLALFVGGLGILIHLRVVRLPGLGIESFWLVAAAFVVLLVAPLLKNL